MNKIIALFFTLSLFFSDSLLGQKVIYQESFESKTALLKEVRNNFNEGIVRGGKYAWKYQGQSPSAVTVYANRLQDRSDFVFEARLKPTKIGSEYGLIWGGVDPQNSYYFLVQGKKFSVCKVKDGKIQCAPDQKIGKVRIDYNVLRIHKKGGRVYYYANENLLYDAP